ncbi:TPA: RHS repeat domain-containing protein, partial [Escherichia coli]
RATAENSVVPFNRLMSYRGVHYRYDEFGRAVEKEGRSGTQSYRYDAEHRMVEVTTARGTYRYVYDALGRRTEKQHISPDGKPYNRTKFLWDGMRLAQESRPEGISSLYIYSDPGSYEPLARVDKAGKEGPNRILYFHTDVNGAPEEMTDSDGKIVWETGYQVWGNTIQEKDHGRVEQNLRYQGQYLDRETGLHYNLHRYYDPDVGRFMVTDPIGLNGGINLYAYVKNPLTWIDPLGLAGCNAQQRRNISDLRNGKDVTVRSVDEARALLDNMPDLRPHVDNFPARSGELYSGTKFSDVWKQPAGTYRGDLYNVKNPLSDVVHNSKNPLHDNNPHYNIIFGDGTKAGIIIVP